MNRRQKEILRILLADTNRHFLVEELAEKTSCSEKTIRNDFKKIEQYLSEHARASLIRKPGLGVYLCIDEEEKPHLFNQLHLVEQPSPYFSEEERIIQIAYLLLMNSKAVSAQDLADEFYVNRAVIKKDLDLIKKWLEKYELVLVSKQKVGLSIDGSEMNKRIALSKLSELIHNQQLTVDFIKSQFSSYEIESVKRELQEFQKRYLLFFTDESLESLLLHTLLMIKRVKMNEPIGVYVEEKELIRAKKEYAWTVDYLKRLGMFFSLRFPEDEVIYLTLHILGSKFRYGTNEPISSSDIVENNPAIREIVQRFTAKMSELYALDFESDQILVNGLKVHLYTTFNRLYYGLAVSNPMLQEIKNMYPFMFNLVLDALENVKEQLPFHVPEEEAGYLVLHFQAAVERYEKDKGLRKTAVIICHMGIGMSQLLRTKIEKNIRLIHIKDCIAKEELKPYLAQHEVDFIISTIDLPEMDVPSIVISPLLEATEEKKLKEFIKKLDYHAPRRKKQSIFMKYTTPFLVLLEKQAENQFKLIEEMAELLYRKGYVEEAFIQNAVDREKTSSTTIGSGIAIPHGNPKYIKQSVVAIATLEQPLKWGTERVSLVFMMALKNENKSEIKQLYQELSHLCEQPERIYSLIREKEAMNFLNLLNE